MELKVPGFFKSIQIDASTNEKQADPAFSTEN